MNKRIASLLVLCLALCLTVSNAAAAVQEIPPPTSVVPGANESNESVIVFAEKKAVQLTRNVEVDFTTPGLYDALTDLPPTKPSIAAGTLVNSYYIYTDQVGETGSRVFAATITFDQPILGVMVNAATIASSTSLLGSGGTTYPSQLGQYGLELSSCTGGQDCVEFIAPATLKIRFTTYNVTDSIRVITQALTPRTITGFYKPVDMDGLNTVNRGRGVPMKFEVFEGETEITDVNQVAISVTPISCPHNVTQAPVEETTTDLTSLRYDVDGGQFIYNWKTPKTAGTCYRVTASSGSASIAADFLLN